jgi:hypothetical protein
VIPAPFLAGPTLLVMLVAPGNVEVLTTVPVIGANLPSFYVTRRLRWVKA